MEFVRFFRFGIGLLKETTSEWGKQPGLNPVSGPAGILRITKWLENRLAVRFPDSGHAPWLIVMRRPWASSPIEIGIIPITVNPGLQKEPWVLRGVLRSPLAFSSRDYDFGDRLVRGQLWEPGKVVLRPLTPLRSVKAEFDNAMISSQIRLDGERWIVELARSQSLTAGPFAATGSIVAVLESGEALPPLPFTVRGLMRNDVEATPSQILLGARTIDEAVEETLLVHSHRGNQFDLRLRSNAPDVSVIITELAPEKKQLTVRQRIVGLGGQRRDLQFAVIGDDEQVLNVYLFYYGLARAE